MEPRISKVILEQPPPLHYVIEETRLSKILAPERRVPEVIVFVENYPLGLWLSSGPGSKD